MTLSIGDTGPDVVEMKSQLRSAGLFSGPDDDYYGEDLAEAVRKYQTSHGLAADGVVGPETWGNIHGDPAYPNGSSAGNSPNTGAGQSPADYDEIKRKYPQFAYLADDPEVGKVLRDANTRSKTTNPMPQGEFEAAIMATNWWRTTASSSRNYYNQQFADPATFNNKIRDYSDQIKVLGGQLGYDETILTPDYLSYFANKSYREGLTPAQMKALLANEITPLIGTTEKSTTLHAMREIQQGYQIAIDDPTRNYWLQAIGNGSQTIENFRGSVVAQAKALFPNLTGQFEQGMTLKQVIEPYRQMLSKEFDGANVEDFDFMDAKWRNVIDYVDEKTGVHRTMSMQELQKYARAQPEWRNTKNAKENVAQIGEQLLQSFGAVA